MPLPLAVEVESIVADGSALTIKDLTVYPALTPRVNYALLLKAVRKNQDLSEIVLVVNNTTPETATTWTVPLSSDGWLVFTLVAVPIFSATATYQTGNIVYRNGKVISAPATTTNPDNWPVVSDPYASTNTLDKLVYNELVTARVEKAYCITVSELECGGCDDCEEHPTQEAEAVYRNGVLLEAIFIKCAEQKWREGDKIIQKLALRLGILTPPKSVC